MTLYNISEPVERSERAQAVGIDLGTTHSLAAMVSASGELAFLEDEQGHTLLPSAVDFTNTDIIVGDRARVGALVSTKRLMGQAVSAVSHLPYPFATAQDADAWLETAAGPKSPQQVAAEILKVLWKRAEKQATCSLKGAVVTVPAYFNDAARKATTDAAKLANIPVLRLINEPTAAAYAYGYQANEPSTLLVFDFGGGTFDVSVLTVEKGVFRVLATGGDLQLGGDSIDAALVEWALQDDKRPLSYIEHKQLQEQCKQAKEALSHQSELTITAGEKIRRLDTDILASLCAPFTKRMLDICKQVLRDANLSTAQVDDILMVGGATRLTAVQKAVTNWFGKNPKMDVDPDTIVARGAALQADRLAGNATDNAAVLIDVTPLSLGLEMMGGMNEKIIPRNTPVPATVTQKFTTYQDGQQGMKLHIVQGEREMAADCLSLAHCELTNLPVHAAGKVEVAVTFTLDADGLLTVSAQDNHDSAQLKLEIKPSYGLDDKQVMQLLESALSHADADVKARHWHSKALDIQQLLQSLENTLPQDAHIHLSATETATLRDLMSNARQAITDTATIQTLTNLSEQLETTASDYIDRRLQASLHQQLSGKSVDDLKDAFDA